MLDGKNEEQFVYFNYAIIGEIGNNSFDHNIGNWPKEMGIFFAIDTDKRMIILADKGQGVLNTLKKVRPKLSNHKEALKLAFTEKVSGRAPENRGNGLKFVRENIKENKMKLEFYSGNARILLNSGIKINEIKENIQGCLAILSY